MRFSSAIILGVHLSSVLALPTPGNAKGADVLNTLDVNAILNTVGRQNAGPGAGPGAAHGAGKGQEKGPGAGKGRGGKGKKEQVAEIGGGVNGGANVVTTIAVC